MIPVLVVFLIYTVLMLTIGYYFYSKDDSLEDYFLGGRSLNPYVTALSAQASDMSGWLLMGFPGAVYAGGFNAMCIGIGLAVGTIINWQFLRVVSAIVILVFFTIYVSSGLVAGGLLFGNVLNVDY